jgi:hypothetical protein
VVVLYARKFLYEQRVILQLLWQGCFLRASDFSEKRHAAYLLFFSILRCDRDGLSLALPELCEGVNLSGWWAGVCGHGYLSDRRVLSCCGAHGWDARRRGLYCRRLLNDNHVLCSHLVPLRLHLCSPSLILRRPFLNWLVRWESLWQCTSPKG